MCVCPFNHFHFRFSTCSMFIYLLLVDITPINDHCYVIRSSIFIVPNWFVLCACVVCVFEFFGSVCLWTFIVCSFVKYFIFVLPELYVIGSEHKVVKSIIWFRFDSLSISPSFFPSVASRLHSLTLFASPSFSSANGNLFPRWMHDATKVQKLFYRGLNFDHLKL